MYINDLINGIFEFIGSAVIWANIFKLYKDKEVKGVFWPVWFFYSVWGIWNLYYYPSLDQWISFSAGIIMVLGNSLWVSMAFYYSKINKNMEF